MCAKEKTASFVSVAPLKASKDQEVCPQIWSHAAAVNPLLPFHCIFSTSLLFLWFTVHFLHFTRGSTCTTGVHKRTDNPTEKPNTLIISSFSLFFNTILYRKRKDLRCSCFLDFQLPNSHTKAHQLSLLQKVCAANDSTVCPSPICFRSSSTSSADNVGYLAKLSCPFCPPSLPNLSPLFTSSNSHV